MQLICDVAKHDPAPQPPGRQLHARQGVERNGVGAERTDVAQRDIRPGCFEQRGDAPADRGQVGTGHRPGDGKDDGGRPHGRHL